MAGRIKLGALAAFSARLTNAIEFEAMQADEETSTLHWDFVSDVHSLSNSLISQGVKLDQSLFVFSKTVDGLPGGLFSTKLQEARNNLIHRLKRPVCKACGGDNHCTAAEVRHHLVSQGGNCIASLRELLDQLIEMCTKLYAGWNAIAPNIQLGLYQADRNENSATLQLVNVEAWHRIKTGEAKISEVNITVKDRQFNLKSACALYYMLLHELICHVFQGAETTETREPAEEKCAWTEGWMDNLALELSQFWLNANRGALPLWLTDRGFEVETISRALHAGRLSMTNVRERQPAVDDRRAAACETFRRLWNRVGRDAPMDQSDVTNFSIRVNMTAMSSAERQHLACTLTGLLKDDKTGRFHNAVGLCRLFAQGQMSWEKFQSEIEMAAMPTAPMLAL